MATNNGAETVCLELTVLGDGVPKTRAAEARHVTRACRMSRWIHGSTFVWTAFRKQVGRGEGSSGLRFDQLIGPGPGQG